VGVGAICPHFSTSAFFQHAAISAEMEVCIYKNKQPYNDMNRISHYLVKEQADQMGLEKLTRDT
jgi:hypothetical protein